MQQYVDLVNRVLREGEPRADRTGVGTLAVFGGRIEFDLRERFPLVTVKETRWKTAFLEMLWFLRGETNTEYLHRHGCTLWDARPSAVSSVICCPRWCSAGGSCRRAAPAPRPQGC